MKIDSSFLPSTIKLFRYYKSLGDKTIAELNDEQLHYQPNEESNSIAILIQHISGNAISRFTDFLTTDGEKSNRNRDAEFESEHRVMNTESDSNRTRRKFTKTELISHWENGWACLFNAIEPLTENDLSKIIFIRNEGHTVTEALQRQLAHYAYHIGQIIYIGKILLNENWKSLSIPRNKSAGFNKERFEKDKERKHFTDRL